MLETIGRGGFGTVYRGLNVQSGQVVAVKRVPLHGIPKSELEGIEVTLRLPCWQLGWPVGGEPDGPGAALVRPRAVVVPEMWGASQPTRVFRALRLVVCAIY